MTIATNSGGRQRTSTDGLSQATDATALAVRVGTWLRDEQAALPDLAVVPIKPKRGALRVGAYA